jgi:hypothetical protein
LTFCGDLCKRSEHLYGVAVPFFPAIISSTAKAAESTETRGEVVQNHDVFPLRVHQAFSMVETEFHLQRLCFYRSGQLGFAQGCSRSSKRSLIVSKPSWITRNTKSRLGFSQLQRALASNGRHDNVVKGDRLCVIAPVLIATSRLLSKFIARS